MYSEKIPSFTVSALNEYVKALLDSSEVLENVCIAGEISNFTNHYKTGHLYFTLKDEKALVKAVMFRSYAQTLNFVPQNNMKVLVFGRVSVFERDGVYQLYAYGMERVGAGELYLKFEEMKKRLSAEGLFDESHKKELPAFPRRIGLITSPEAAAVADMKSILLRRYPICEIHIYPALVQGPDAPAELCEGIRRFDKDADCDLIIIGRGGGSIEDLWAFNDETLARTVFACKTPVISAVGHETDFTICDFVADKRAPTPSAAAELAVPDSGELKAHLEILKSVVDANAAGIILSGKARLSLLKERQCLKSPAFYVEKRQELLLNSDIKIASLISSLLTEKKARLSVSASKLYALNPMAVLSRGYSAVFDEKGKVVSTADKLTSGQTVTLTFCDGEAKATIEAVNKRETLTGE